MNPDLKNITIRQLIKDEPIPWALLLDADPSEEVITGYLKYSEIYIALLKDKVIGVYVLFPLDSGALEIKNIAVKNEFQRKGIGKLLLDHATGTALKKGAGTLVIATSNASFEALSLYQKEGFQMTGIKLNFILDNYPEPLFDNGIQCKHMLILAKQLQPKS